MANVLAIRSVANSLATWLGNTYEAADIPSKPPFSFSVVSSSQLALDDEPENAGDEPNRVTLYLYRAGVNPHLRTSGRILRPDMDPPPLSLNLHFLFSIWTGSASDEHTILAWLMRALHEHPVLDASSLGFEGGWGPEEVVQMIPEELSTEDLMRIWDALAPSYRLSIPYIARVVRIDPDSPGRDFAPVVATRFQVRDSTQPTPP
jgi:hypothetical protein